MDEEAQEQPRSALTKAISAIRDGDLSQTHVARLSDLSRENALALAGAWESIPEGNRIDLVRRFDELSEERVELNFGRALRVALDDPSAVVRQLAIAGLWEDESSELLDRFRLMLEDDPSPDVRAQAAAALERFSGRAVEGTLDERLATTLRDDLRRAARDAEAPYAVQRKALESLGPYAADPEISSLIAEAYDSGDHGLQCSAIYAMGRSHDSRWLPTILLELESEEPEIRFEAARAAGLLGATDALQVLLEAARDDDAEVRHVAISAIAQIGGRGAVRALERLAEDAGEADIELIESALDEANTLLEPIPPFLVTGAEIRVQRLSKVTADPMAWDAAVLNHNGHLLQSWRWGAFKERFGWDVERIAVPHPEGSAFAQVLFRRKAGVSIGYIPRGPVLFSGDSTACTELWRRLDEVARRRRTLTIIVEPDAETLESSSQPLRAATGLAPIQPSRSVKVDLLDDEALVEQMHAKTRYNVRLARRRGVAIRATEDIDSAIDDFYIMLCDTASRNAFVVHSPDYYQDFLRVFGEDACLMFAEFEGKRVAGAIAAVFGDEGIYMYGASSTRDRAHGAAFLLQHEMMRWARGRGARRYDLWGIPDYDPESSVSESGDRLAASKGDDRRGLYEFKTRFGGKIVRYSPPLERTYHPVLASFARRFYSPGGSG